MRGEQQAGTAPESIAETPMKAFAEGVFVALPTMVMVIPFGTLSGAIFAETGLSIVEALAFSIGIYAGAAQLASLGLMQDGASLFVVVATGIAINLRFMMYSAVTAPWFAPTSFGLRATAAYITTDNIIGQAALRYRSRPEEPARDKVIFFLGAGAISWTVWNAATAVGYYIGAAAPLWLGLDFAAPIAFTGIAMQMLNDRPSVVAAVAASGAAIACRDLPLNLGVIVAAIVGVAAALMAEELQTRRASRQGGQT